MPSCSGTSYWSWINVNCSRIKLEKGISCYLILQQEHSLTLNVVLNHRTEIKIQSFNFTLHKSCFPYCLHVHIYPPCIVPVLCTSGSALQKSRDMFSKTIFAQEEDLLFFFSVKSVVRPRSKWGPWSFCFRRQGAVTARLAEPSLPLLFSLHHGPRHTWHIVREETGQTLLLSTGVIDSWVSRTLMLPGG